MSQKIITICFYILLALTPFIWLPFTSELFEFNKMMLVYLLTATIFSFWLIKMIGQKKLLVKRTPFDIPILLFLLANCLSTLFSIDQHTSVWGYYSRSNGGLLSTFTYIILYYALVSNFAKDQVLRFLKVSIFSSVAVALYAIPEHFGYSLSCVIIQKQFNDACWVQDVQARVFATLGQPNWLAAYLGMLIFPTIYFLLKAKGKLKVGLWYLAISAMYLAFTFTYSRGATLGVITGLVIFLALVSLQIKNKKFTLGSLTLSPPKNWRALGVILAIFLAVNILFGSTFLTRFKLITQQIAPRPQVAATTQLETGGTESGTIRLIVWQGALDIFKHYPIFGSGVETFAYSYYNFRPLAHNLVSEWDFLYNKAHNEYLNYLATTGLVGTLTYLTLILAFIIWSVKIIITYKLSQQTDSAILLIALLSGYISYLIQNFFGFSVVVISLLFYLFPAFASSTSESLSDFKLPKNLGQNLSQLAQATIYRKPLFTKLSQTIIFISLLLVIKTLAYYWIADTLYAQGLRDDQFGSPQSAFEFLVQATGLNKGEPLYHSELGYSAAGYSIISSEQDATGSAQLRDIALSETSKALQISPQNVSIHRTAVRTYYLLSSMDPKYFDKALAEINATITLAPTDPKLTYNKAVILVQSGNDKEAINALQKTVQLKPNYRDAYFALGMIEFEVGNKDQAIEQMKTVLKLVPNDPDASQKLKEWGG
ncbi:O-antigen ligase family protein [Candidatus Daviesbacteria bacterium]|nr:O-antigen ligase family protein [Candidatus Daviesbacteria bacterium]